MDSFPSLHIDFSRAIVYVAIAILFICAPHLTFLMYGICRPVVPISVHRRMSVLL